MAEDKRYSRQTLKSYFRSGSVPKEEHFAALIDSMYNFVDDDKPEEVIPVPEPVVEEPEEKRQNRFPYRTLPLRTARRMPTASGTTCRYRAGGKTGFPVAACSTSLPVTGRTTALTECRRRLSACVKAAVRNFLPHRKAAGASGKVPSVSAGRDTEAACSCKSRGRGKSTGKASSITAYGNFGVIRRHHQTGSL